MRPASPLTLRPEYADDPSWVARLPQQGNDAPTVRDDNAGALVPSEVKGDAGSGGGGGAGGGSGGAGGLADCFSGPSLIMFGAMFAVMYFFIIRPQRKQEQERQALLASVKAGDKIVTTGGIHATIERVSEATVDIRIDELIMTIDRAAVGRVERDPKPGSTS